MDGRRLFANYGCSKSLVAVGPGSQAHRSVTRDVRCRTDVRICCVPARNWAGGKRPSYGRKATAQRVTGIRGAGNLN